MPKDSRLTIRITDELDAWIGAEASRRGLDKAAFARMALYERMNGGPVIQAATPTLERDVIDVHADDRADEMRSHPSDDGTGINLDAMVEQGLAAADAAGLTTASPEEQEVPQAIGGVRSLHRQPPPFSRPLPGHVVGR